MAQPGKLAVHPKDLGPRFSIAALLGFNLAVKLLWLGVNDLSGDEPFTMYWSQRPWPDLKDMLLTEGRPPLHFLITRQWSTLVPFEAAWIRVPSALFSALAVWPLFLIARKLGRDRMAWACALLFSFSNYQFGCAHEASAHALFTLLAIWSMWIVVREPGAPVVGWSGILALALLNGLLTWVHPIGWLLVAMQSACMLVIPDLRAWRRAHLLSALITAALFAPIAIICFTEAVSPVAGKATASAPVSDAIDEVLRGWFNSPFLAAPFLFILTVAAFRSRLRHSVLRLGVAWSFVPVLLLFAVNRWISVSVDWLLACAAPGFALVVAASCEALRIPASIHRFALALAVLLMLITFHPWKAGGMRPSTVAEQVSAWCANDCHIEVVPTSYWLEYLAAEDIDLLRQDQEALLNSTPLLPDRKQAEAIGTYILVDASADGEGAEVLNRLRTQFPRVEMASPDRAVRVYRFVH